MPAACQADIREVIERLEGQYGRPRYIPRFDPMDELVSCILSQHSADANSFPTFTRLRETFPDWEDVAALPADRLAEVIRHAGLANQKARSILACLRGIKDRFGDYTLEPIRKMQTKEAYDWLLSLPGVGPKTASIVLCFAFGRETIPVDTHVYRVSCRLGWVPEGVKEVKAHDLLRELVPGDLAFRYHVTLIQHGRVVCRAAVPRCAECPVTADCAFFRSGQPPRKRSQTRLK